MRTPEIEDDVPIPENENWMDSTLKEMSPGQSIKLTRDEANMWRNRISSHYPGQFTTRKIDNDTVRIWKK